MKKRSGPLALLLLLGHLTGSCGMMAEGEPILLGKHWPRKPMGCELLILLRDGEPLERDHVTIALIRAKSLHNFSHALKELQRQACRVGADGFFRIELRVGTDVELPLILGTPGMVDPTFTVQAEAIVFRD